MRYRRILLLVATVLLASSATPQVLRVSPFRPHPNLSFGTFTCTASPSTVTFTLVPKGIALASGAITVTTTYSGLSLAGSFDTYAYFTSATSALSGGTPVSFIPTSAVLGKVPTGIPTSYTAFTGTGPFGGAGASLELSTVSPVLSLGGTLTSVLSLEINLASLPQLPAATYTGTLFLETQAM